jgi:hypothetical protein
MKTWNNTDKSTWADGPWKDEPDKAHWVDPTTGLDCLIVRNNGGALCGYVGVPEGHPKHGVDYNNVAVNCHGGLTFANKCSPSENPARGICHVAEDAANDNVWWLGFDCAHYLDISPAYESHGGSGFLFSEGSYKDFDYVRQEVEYLARQLRDMS